LSSHLQRWTLATDSQPQGLIEFEEKIAANVLMDEKGRVYVSLENPQACFFLIVQRRSFWLVVFFDLKQNSKVVNVQWHFGNARMVLDTP
jgi:hypothetical protein